MASDAERPTVYIDISSITQNLASSGLWEFKESKDIKAGDTASALWVFFIDPVCKTGGTWEGAHGYGNGRGSVKSSLRRQETPSADRVVLEKPPLLKQSYTKRVSISKLSGNEIYCIA